MIKKRTIRGQNSRPGETDPYFFQFEIFHFCVQTIEIFVGKTKYSMVKEASNVKISICNFGTNTPGTRGGPGGRDRTLAVKSRKTPKNQLFCCKKIKITINFKCICLLVMPKYWGKKFSASGVSPKWVKSNKTHFYSL